VCWTTQKNAGGKKRRRSSTLTAKNRRNRKEAYKEETKKPRTGNYNDAGHPPSVREMVESEGLIREYPRENERTGSKRKQASPRCGKRTQYAKTK